jgi:P27 family predicted phage terminase small subunit
MGTRGPPPTPTNILRRRGSWRGNRPDEPKGPRGRPRCPKWLDDEAKAAWRRVVPRLAAMGVLSLIDGHALVRYCCLWSRWRKAEQFLQGQGEVYLDKDESGRVRGVRPYPQVKIAAQLSEQLLRIEAQFGLTPSARTRLVAPAAPEIPDAEDKRRFLDLG